MTMLVETYEIERADEETLNAIRDGEAKQLIESLGLTGQEKFYNGETLEAIPYRKMTKQESVVFKQLCPQECSVESYKDGLIPLRVLQVYQHARSLEFFDKGFQVWYPESADIKDPFLVGLKTGEREYITELYILARWGEELLSFDQMKECAEKVYRSKLAAKLRSIANNVNARLASLERGEEVDMEDGLPYCNA